MEILPVTGELVEKYVNKIPELVHATGPVSYDYHFGRRELLDEVVRRSWLTPGTLFAAESTRIAVEAGELMGIEIGVLGPEFHQRAGALGQIWQEILSSGMAGLDEFEGFVERAELASWLNPFLAPHVYYVHALSVKADFRGRQVGVKLLENAKMRAQELGRSMLQLDVLSDNPAVHFYFSQGLELLVESRAPKPEEFGVPPEWRMGIKLE